MDTVPGTLAVVTGRRPRSCARRRRSRSSARPRTGRPSHGVMAYLLAPATGAFRSARTATRCSAYLPSPRSSSSRGRSTSSTSSGGREFCAEHAREAVAAGASALWLQLGIVSPRRAWSRERRGWTTSRTRVPRSCTRCERGRQELLTRQEPGDNSTRPTDFCFSGSVDRTDDGGSRAAEAPRLLRRRRPARHRRLLRLDSASGRRRSWPTFAALAETLGICCSRPGFRRRWPRSRSSS